MKYIITLTLPDGSQEQHNYDALPSLYGYVHALEKCIIKEFTVTIK